MDNNSLFCEMHKQSIEEVEKNHWRGLFKWQK